MAQNNFNGDAAEWTYESGGVLMEENNNSNNSKPLKKGPWTAAEDQILMEYVRKHGEGNWNSLQKNSGLNRCGKSCRLRWANHLRPNLKKGAFTPEEERLILELHARYGNKWARMASQLPGRTDNEIKNYWNTKVKRRQRKGLLPPHPHEMKQSHFISHNSQSNDNLTTVIPTDQSSFGFELPSSQTQQLPPLSSSTPSLANYNNNPIPIFDAATSTPSYALHRPPPILGYKRYRETLTFSPPISPTLPKNSSVLRTSSMPDISSYQHYASGSSSNTSSMPDMASLQFQPPPSTNFHGSFPPLPQSTASNQFEIGDILSSPTKPAYSTKPEIMPSTQVAPQISTTYHHPQFEITNNTESNDINAANASVVIDNNETHNYYNIGMLESLLQEAEALTSGDTNPNKSALIPPLVSFEDQKRVLDDLDQCLQPTSSINNHSFLEMKAIPDHEHMKSLPDDLSKLMSFEPVSDWYGANNGNYSTLANLMEYHT